MYQQKVGSLLYVTTITRPDAAKAASKLSEFLLNPSPRHIEAVERAISYLYGTRHLAIQYGPRCGQDAFTCSSDAAFSDNQDEGARMDTSSHYLEAPSTGKKTVTTSSTEAELLGLTQTAKETYWWKRLFNGLCQGPNPCQGHNISRGLISEYMCNPCPHKTLYLLCSLESFPFSPSCTEIFVQ
jgi:hypothetical protein